MQKRRITLLLTVILASASSLSAADAIVPFFSAFTVNSMSNPVGQAFDALFYPMLSSGAIALLILGKFGLDILRAFREGDKEKQTKAIFAVVITLVVLFCIGSIMMWLFGNVPQYPVSGLTASA